MSKSISLKSIEVTDLFWKHYMELVRKEVIPYQWKALNDQVEGAAKSYAMRNFKLAGDVVKKRKEQGVDSVPVFPTNIFETLPKNNEHMEDCFYGFLFQDSDFSKWIEAVAYSLTQNPDVELERIADGAIDIVCGAQMDDGYLDTYYIINDTSKRFTNLRDHHELYCFGHLTEGAVAYYQATGKDKLLNAAKRFADCIYERFGKDEGKSKGYPGHEIAEMALMRMYDLTKEGKYLELAKFFVDERGQRPYYYDIEHKLNCKLEDESWHYHQAHRPVRQQDEAVGHAVRAVYLYSGMADVANETKDEGLVKACEFLWNNITNKKMYITGGIGGTHIGEAFSFAYDLPNDTAYAETCASIGLVFFAIRMLNIKVKGEYGDVMERALYNGVLSGMALDGKSFFYVNPLEVLPTACLKDERKRHVKPIRQKWFGCACCPPNIARLVSSIASYAYSVEKDTIYMHLFMGCRQTQVLDGKEVSFNVESNYPWKEDVKIEISMDEPHEFTYAVRIPSWCKNSGKGITGLKGMGIQINRSDAEYELKDGYAYIKRVWKQGDVISLYIPLEVKTYRSNKLVRENAGKIAVMRGPLVYCMEEIDNSKNLHLYRLKQDADFKSVYKEDLLDGVIELTTKGFKAVASDYENESLYIEAFKEEYEAVPMTFVPYYTWNNRGEGEMQVWVEEML